MYYITTREREDGQKVRKAKCLGKILGLSTRPLASHLSMFSLLQISTGNTYTVQLMRSYRTVTLSVNGNQAATADIG